MPTLKKPIKKIAKEEIPMFHLTNIVSFEVDGNTVEGEITEIDNDAKTATVVDDNGDSYSCEFSELTFVSDKKGKKSEPAKPAKKPSKKSDDDDIDDFAKIFNKIKGATGGGGLPEGVWEAKTVEGGLNETDKGLSGFIKYEIVEGEHEGRQGVQFFQLLDAGGDELQGFSFFRGALEQLGVIDADTMLNSRAEMEKILESVEDQTLEINVKQNAKGYTNIYINDVH